MNDVRRAPRFPAFIALLVAALVLGAGPAAAATPAPTAPQVLELGKGPTLVMVHELGGSRMSWLPTARKLIASHHVVLVDLPGHGGSALPDPFSLEAAAEALDLVLAKQNPDSTVLVGSGMGGMLLLQDLKAHPDRARGLVLIDAALKWSGPTVDAEGMKWLNTMLDEHYDEFIKMTYGHAGRDSVEGLRIRALAAQVPAPTMKAYLRNIFTADVTGAYKSLTFPTLYVATDRMFRNRGTDKPPDWPTIAKLVGFDDTTSVALRRIPGSSTLVMQDMPDSLAAVLGDFSARALAAKR